MSSVAPRFPLLDTGYTLQLRPLVTHKDDRERGLQNWALCLWLTLGDHLYEIAGLSGFLFERAKVDELDPSRELLASARDMLTLGPAHWEKAPKDERRVLQPSHVKWLANEQAVAEFRSAIDQMVS